MLHKLPYIGRTMEPSLTSYYSALSYKIQRMKQQPEPEQTIETFLEAKEMNHGISQSPIYIESSNVHYDKTMISDPAKRKKNPNPNERITEKIYGRDTPKSKRDIS